MQFLCVFYLLNFGRINHAGQGLGRWASGMDSGEDAGVEGIVLRWAAAALLGADMDGGYVGEAGGAIAERLLHRLTGRHVPVLVVREDIVAGSIYRDGGDADIVVIVWIVVSQTLGQLHLATGKIEA